MFFFFFKKSGILLCFNHQWFATCEHHGNTLVSQNHWKLLKCDSILVLVILCEPEVFGLGTADHCRLNPQLPVLFYTTPTASQLLWKVFLHCTLIGKNKVIWVPLWWIFGNHHTPPNTQGRQGCPWGCVSRAACGHLASSSGCRWLSPAKPPWSILET